MRLYLDERVASHSASATGSVGWSYRYDVPRRGYRFWPILAVGIESTITSTRSPDRKGRERSLTDPSSSTTVSVLLVCIGSSQRPVSHRSYCEADRWEPGT